MSETTQKPRNIRTAVLLLWLAVLASFAREVSRSTDWVVVLALSLFFVLLVFVVHSISLGRNWARVVYLLIVLAGMLVSVPDMVTTAPHSPIAASFSFAVLAAQLIAIYMVFTAPGSSWFAKPLAVT